MKESNKLEIERKKRYLKRYRKNRALVDRLEEKLALIDDRLSSVASPVISNEPKGNPTKTREERILDKIELEERINYLQDKGREIRKEICNSIDLLDDVRYAEILEMYFIECLDFDTIADSKGYDKRHVVRLYSIALDMVTIE